MALVKYAFFEKIIFLSHLIGQLFDNIELNFYTSYLIIDHGVSDRLGYEASRKKMAHFEQLENFCSVFQSGLAFLSN